MHGPANYLSKLMGVLFDMDQMIGKDFEAGLATLKTLAEATPAPPPAEAPAPDVAPQEPPAVSDASAS